MSGNRSDKEGFRQTLNTHLEQLHEGVGLSLIVWLVVYTQAAGGRAKQTAYKQHLKQSQVEYKAFNALAKQSLACGADAEAALVQFQQSLKVVALHDPRVVEITG